MGISEAKKKIVIENYFKAECNINTTIKEAFTRGFELGLKKAPAPQQGECKSCRHRDPEDKKCDCGAKERQGCPFPVSDDYFCKFYEKGGAE